MTSPFLEDHLPVLARALARVVQERGAQCNVALFELERLCGIPVAYARAIGQRFVRDLASATAPLGFGVTFADGRFVCAPARAS